MLILQRSALLGMVSLSQMCLSSRSVGMSSICACPKVPIASSDDQDVFG